MTFRPIHYFHNLTFQIAFSISLGSRTLVLTALSATEVNIVIIPRNEPVLQVYIAGTVTGRQYTVAGNAPLLEVTDTSARPGVVIQYYVRGRYHSGAFTGDVYARMGPLTGSRKLT